MSSLSPVESKNVVQFGDGRHVLDAAVGTCGVVDLQPWFERFDPLGRGRVGLRVCPFAQAGLDEALGLAVGARGVGSGSLMADALLCQQVAEGKAFVSRPVVG